MTIHPFPSTAAPQASAAARVRKEIADYIERLIAVLDALDEEVDMEDGADAEPSLGWTAAGGGVDGCDDREAEDEHDEDGGDDEPWLGRLETLHQGGGTYGGLCPLTDAAHWHPAAQPAAMVELTGAGIPVFRVR